MDNTHLTYILYSISCTMCKTLKPLYLIYDLDSHNVKICSKIIHMLRVTTSLLRSLCKKWFSFQNDTQSSFHHDKLTSVIPYIIFHIFFSNTTTRADWYGTLEDNSYRLLRYNTFQKHGLMQVIWFEYCVSLA